MTAEDPQVAAAAAAVAAGEQEAAAYWHAAAASPGDGMPVPLSEPVGVHPVVGLGYGPMPGPMPTYASDAVGGVGIMDSLDGVVWPTRTDPGVVYVSPGTASKQTLRGRLRRAWAVLTAG